MSWTHTNTIHENAAAALGRQILSAEDYRDAIASDLAAGRPFCAAALYLDAQKIPWRNRRESLATVEESAPGLREHFGDDIVAGYWSAVEVASRNS